MANTDTNTRRGQLAANCTEATSNGCQILGDLMYNLSDVCLGGGDRRARTGGVVGALGKSVSDALEASAKAVRKATAMTERQEATAEVAESAPAKGA